MEILCTRPGCLHLNSFPELDHRSTLSSSQQKYCTRCGMPLILGGHFMPVRLLGQGGFGAAFLARDRYTPSLRYCVVKQFRPLGQFNEQTLNKALDLFEREAMVLDTLGRRHDQIPELYAFFPLMISNSSAQAEEQFFYIVQEYIEGKNLEDELAEKGAFSEAEVRYILTEMLNLLQFVHENGSIHRDIKPSNIMRDKQGRLYLLDFGAVKQVTVNINNPNSPQPTPKGSTGIFSMGFAPPEQMSGKKVYPSTDLYALAISCLTLLTGKSPDELYDVDQDGLNWKRYLPDLSEQLTAIFERMLQDNPNDRFQSAQEILTQLKPPQVTTSIQPQPKIQPPIQTQTQPQIQPPIQTPIQTPIPTPIPIKPKRQFSLLEILGGAAFTGFEGSLLIFALTSVISSPGIIVGFMLIGGLVFMQSRRIIEGKDLPIIAGITGLLFLLPLFTQDFPIQTVLIVSATIAIIAIGITSLFRLIYQLLAQAIN
ncbi:serine/threonine protein kinase [Gloeothece citriformis PCC 7424]|uniref:non-specific serine/threonine protein kinase n=1 Tax=Gloeothece citriformis (strain PCC 7424) TaxID=65393 RepID=B7KBY6_GLOC7|nr:serine/threonine-protein kinase [Gloeothece citriformis]ACK68809.1 serine/threonine protein kinase [Gloeothece citriformis PCC 7424]